MFSWKAIRTICVLLLMLPLAHFVVLLSRDMLAVMDASPEAWENELQAYGRTDARNKLPEEPILVVGGMRVKLWQDLDDMLAPRPVLMRGLGDATVNDLNHNYARLIGFYKPDTVVLLTSNSEFHIRDSKSAGELDKAIRDFVDLNTSQGGVRRIYLFAPLKTPRHPADDATIEQATALLATWTAGHEQAVLLDANAVLTNGNGRPRPEFFRSDGINLNEYGYMRLALLLQAQIELDELDLVERSTVKFSLR